MGVIGPIALAQLAAWERIADTWVMQIQTRYVAGLIGGDPSKMEGHLTCGACDQTVKVIENDSGHYIMTIQEIRAALVAHLRNIHRELDPDEKGGIGE